MTDIDFMVCVMGNGDGLRRCLPAFFGSLYRLSLDGVRVCVVLRDCCPIPEDAMRMVESSPVVMEMHNCPLPSASNSCDDTAQVCDWMVRTVSTAPWFVVSHFDVVFSGDYIQFIRREMVAASMIGNHHDGVVAVSRRAYDECQVGFCRLDDFIVYRNSGEELKVAPRGSPFIGHDAGRCICLDVGELLALRMRTLGFNHYWLQRGGDYGKSELFRHTRRGSGHGGGRDFNDQAVAMRGYDGSEDDG